jgi:hypothetical protein
MPQSSEIYPAYTHCGFFCEVLQNFASTSVIYNVSPYTIIHVHIWAFTDGVIFERVLVQVFSESTI